MLCYVALCFAISLCKKLFSILYKFLYIPFAVLRCCMLLILYKFTKPLTCKGLIQLLLPFLDNQPRDIKDLKVYGEWANEEEDGSPDFRDEFDEQPEAEKTVGWDWQIMVPRIVLTHKFS